MPNTTTMSTQATPGEFERFILRPENSDRLFEYVAGAIVEKVPRFYGSVIGGNILAPLVGFARESGLGHVTGAKGYYCVFEDRYLPSSAYLSKARQPRLSREIFGPLPPDLAVEMITPTTSARVLRIKLGNYLAAGTRVWVVHPETNEVEDYTPGQPVKMIGVDGALEGGDLLPGFSLAVKDIFPE